MERNSTLYTFNERGVRNLLTQASLCGIIKDATVEKSKLYKFASYKRKSRELQLDMRRLGRLMRDSGYILSKTYVNNKAIFKLDEKKLAELTDEHATTIKAREFNIPEKFVSLEHVTTVTRNLVRDENSCPLCGDAVEGHYTEHLVKSHETMLLVGSKTTKVNECAVLIDENYQNLSISIESQLGVKQIFLFSEDRDTEFAYSLTDNDLSLTVGLGRSFFSRQENFHLIIVCCEKPETVELYKLSIRGSLEDIIRSRRMKKESILGFLPAKRKELETYESDKSLLTFFTEDFTFIEAPQYSNYQTLKRHRDLVNFRDNGSILTAQNYKDILQVLVEIDDLFINRALNTFELANVKVQRKHLSYCIEIAGIADFPDVVEEGDTIVFHIPKLVQAEFNIHKIDDGRIYFAGRDKLNFSLSYDVSFQKDRTTIQMERDALSNLEDGLFPKMLFPESYGHKSEDGFNFKWFNPSIGKNFEQKQAVVNIVKGTAFPAPYIIFGPPGTGKTSTIVETIAQIWKLKPKANILVTAPSNFACDEIAIRLMKFIPQEELYRYYSRSAVGGVKEISNELLLISNLSFSGVYTAPTINVLRKYRIILSTVINSGRLALSGLPKDHFQYIFLDECGSSTEATSIIPIAGLISTYGHTNVVIAGDPKQLGPIVKCEFAGNTGLGTSLLERLMDMSFYQPRDGKYNQNVITKLLQNFRSHPAILEIPNTMFYDGELVAKGSASNVNFALNWSFLPNKTFPIIFHAVTGDTRKCSKSTSFYNYQEIDQVFVYLKEIIENGVNGSKIPLEEIGIVSPYRLQCQRIIAKLKNFGWNAVEVGSSEQFQGKEKKIIILSTVRSNTSTAGFLGNPKRLNVVITRAKGLLIVIGNPKTLRLDPNWATLLDFYEKNGAVTGAMERKICKSSMNDKVLDSLDKLMALVLNLKDSNEAK